MKKVLLFAVIVCGLAFTSCSKSDCECTIGGVTTTFNEDDRPDGETQSIKDACNEADEDLTGGDGCKMV